MSEKMIDTVTLGAARKYTDKAIDNLDISGEVAEQLPSAVDDYLSDRIDPETGYVLDNSLTLENAAAQAKAVGDAVSSLKSALTQISYTANDFYVTKPVNGTYNGVTVTYHDDNTITFNGTCTGTFCIGICGSKIGSPIGVDGENYKGGFPGQTYVKSAANIISGSINGSAPSIRYTTSTITSGTVLVNDEPVTLLEESYLVLTILTGRSFSNARIMFTIAKGISIVKTANDKVVRNTCEEIKDNIDLLFLNSNNLLTLDDFYTVVNGITLSIKNNIITMQGICTADTRIKLTDGYDIADNGSIPDSWKTGTLTQFESGHTYSIHNVNISGNGKPNGAGVSIRDANGNSVISLSKPEVTINSTMSFAMLYIPSGTVADGSYCAMFIEGQVTDEAYYKKLNGVVSIDGVKRYALPDMSADFIYNAELECAMKFPSEYKVIGEKTPLIVLCHGLSSTIDESHWGSDDMETLVNNFVTSGYAVLDVNQVTTQDWINPALVKKYLNAIRYATDTYNVIPKVIYGESMGCLIGMCLSTLINTIKTCVISGLRLDFEARYYNLTSEQKSIVDANLGFTDGYDKYLTCGWDKTAYYCADDENNKICPVQFPPTLFVIGTQDTYNTVSEAKIDQIKKGGTITKSNEYEGNHNSVCYLKAGTSYDDAIAWISQWL